jgi:hypothetical protein
MKQGFITMPFDSIRFWINAFIPDSVCVLKGDLFAVEIPSISPPFPLRFFAGDQRSFSDNLDASARMHSEVMIVGLSSDTPQIAEERQICGESLELDEQGNILQRATAPTDRMKFTNLRGSQTIDPEGGVVDGIPGSVQIDFFGSSSLPLIAAPDLDYSGTLVIDRAEGNILVSGATDGFPAYEMYCSIDNGAVMTLSLINPISPIELIGSENQPFSTSTRIVL